MREDLLFLQQAVEAGHPLTLVKQDFSELGELREGIPDTALNALEYESVIREALCVLGCAHTVILESPLKEEYTAPLAAKPCLPARFYWDSDALHILETQDGHARKDVQFPLQVLSINQVPAKVLTRWAANYQAVDGRHDGMGKLLIRDFGDILLRRYFYATERFQLHCVSQAGDTLLIEMDAEEAAIAKEKTTAPPAGSEVLLKTDQLEMRRLQDGAGLLQIAHFNYEAEEHVDLFRLLKLHDMDSLILDLRGNTGGQPDLVLDFLSYILDENLEQVDIRPKGEVGPYLDSSLKLAGVWFWDLVTPHEDRPEGRFYFTNRTTPKPELYTGRVLLLQDSYTASSASMLAACLRHKAGSTILGGSSAGGESGSNANSFHRLVLPRSGIVIQFPLFRFRHPLAIADRQACIQPDIRVQHSVSDQFSGRDLVLERALLLQ